MARPSKKGGMQGTLGKKRRVDETPTRRAAKTAATTSIARDLMAPAHPGGLGAKLETVTSAAGKRQAIAVHFVHMHEAASNGEGKCWEGKDGIAVEVAKAMPSSPDPRTVRPVMQDVVACVRLGVECDPEATGPSNGKTKGRVPCIGLDARCARIVADAIEAGLGIRTALGNVNAARCCVVTTPWSLSW